MGQAEHPDRAVGRTGIARLDQPIARLGHVGCGACGREQFMRLRPDQKRLGNLRLEWCELGIEEAGIGALRKLVR